jgi:hypothetical protein
MKKYKKTINNFKLFFLYLEYGEFVELRDMVVPSRGDFLFFLMFVCVCVLS